VEASTPGRRVLITGGSGFVGSHLAERLLQQGEHVTLLDNLSTGRLDNIAHIRGHANLKVVLDEVAHEMVLDRLVSESDVVFHLAAAVGVRLVVENPKHTIETNVLGTHAVLQAAARYQVRTMVASTSEVYGKGIRLPFAEDDDVVLGPTSKSRWSYAASKMIDEFLTFAYQQQLGLPATVFRLFNTVGPRQTAQYGMVIPRFVSAALKGEPLPVHGDGEQSRCFLHVQDAIDAIDRLSRMPESIGQLYNVGSSEPITIMGLAHRVLDHVVGTDPSSHEGRIRLVPYEEAFASGFEDMRSRMPDTAKVRAATGWAPKRSLDNILTDVIEERRAGGEGSHLALANANGR